MLKSFKINEAGIASQKFRDTVLGCAVKHGDRRGTIEAMGSNGPLVVRWGGHSTHVERLTPELCASIGIAPNGTDIPASAQTPGADEPSPVLDHDARCRVVMGVPEWAQPSVAAALDLQFVDKRADRVAELRVIAHPCAAV